METLLLTVKINKLLQKTINMIGIIFKIFMLCFFHVNIDVNIFIVPHVYTEP